VRQSRFSRNGRPVPDLQRRSGAVFDEAAADLTEQRSVEGEHRLPAFFGRQMPERLVAQSTIASLCGFAAVFSAVAQPRELSRSEQTGLSTSVETMQGRDAVVFLEIGRFGGDLCRVELDLFGIFLSLDFDEAAFDRLFHRFGQIT